MDIIAIIQARMSSNRFPGKVLHIVNNKYLLQYIIERIKVLNHFKQVIIATSNKKSDNPIKEFCDSFGLVCYRGSLCNVVDRFQSLLNEFPCDAFLRINGDSPLIDHQLIEKGISLFYNGNYDLVTNVLKRTFPKGQSVEIVKTEIFRKLNQKDLSSDEKEHVTSFFYNNEFLYNICNFSSKRNMSNMQLSVDTIEDMKMINKILNNITKQHFCYSWLELVDIYRSLK